MDPITHILVGIALTTCSGAPVSPDNPTLWAATLGALIPDGDLIYRLKGEVPYLNRHRGSSHSLIGVIVLSAMTAALLYLFFTAAGFQDLFYWALAGGCSHLLLDFFNPHGIQALWPLNKKRYHWSLLNGVDPFVLLISLLIIFSGTHSPTVSRFLFLWYGVYLLWRWTMSRRVVNTIKEHFTGAGPARIIAMPAVFSLWTWDFVVYCHLTVITGEIRYFSQEYRVMSILKKYEDKTLKTILNTKIGRFFSEFTPYFYVHLKSRDDNKTVLEFIDLRYRVKNRFLHSATAVLDEQGEIMEAFFHPFSKNRHIPLIHRDGSYVLF